MPTAMEVAAFFLASNPLNSISNLKLQKLCAYAQAVSIAYLGEKMFSENIEMWELGPVVREVYNAYKAYDDSPIPRPMLDLTPFTLQQRLVLAGVNNHYADVFDAWGLCQQSHREFPWKRGTNQILKDTDLKEAFAENPLVCQLRRGDAPLTESPKTVTAKEFFDALAS